jgi:hypothetical protein
MCPTSTTTTRKVAWAPQAGLARVLPRGPDDRGAVRRDARPGQDRRADHGLLSARGRGLGRGVEGHPVPADASAAPRRDREEQEVGQAHLARGVLQRDQNALGMADRRALYFAHFNTPSQYSDYHGHAYPWIGWEELTTWPNPDCYKVMFSCSRSTIKGMPRKVRATTNPYGVGHNWVKMRASNCRSVVRPSTGASLLGPVIDSVDETGQQRAAAPRDPRIPRREQALAARRPGLQGTHQSGGP